MKVLFAGVINTGVVSESQRPRWSTNDKLTLYKKACWALVYLAIHSEWREKCKQEIQDLIFRHSDSPPSSTLGEKLGAVPISGWQNELPMLDACLQETHRICLTPMAFRRNLGKEINIGGQVVKRGDFVVYPIAEFHLNPEFYPEPYKFDPSRWLRPDPVPNATHKFLGWGSGRHACTGMKVAKLEMKMILAVFLEKYDYELVDGDGKRVSQMPVPNRNDLNQVSVR
jgi:cytochrome P450